MDVNDQDCKVADFGFVRMNDPSTEELQGFVGSLDHMAP